MKGCAIHFLAFLLKSGSTRLDVDKCLEKVSIKLKIKKIKSTPNKKPLYKETVQTVGKQKKDLTGLTTDITVLKSKFREKGALLRHNKSHDPILPLYP